MANRTVLGIESSCDETSAAVVRLSDGALTVLSCHTADQNDLHRTYKGVVPEIASRAHVESIIGVIRCALREADTSLEQIDAIAAGNRPGLIGSLLVGTSAAKALAWARSIPFVGVDHVVAHLTAALLDGDPLDAPAIGLVASGGHTSLFRMNSPLDVELIGATVDDAAGEAFDKAAAILDLGYPGGARLDELAQSGDESLVSLPITDLKGLDFSFSGVKTALSLAAKNPPHGATTADLAASLRHAVVAQLVRKLQQAMEVAPVRSCVIGGGVAANRLLRREVEALCARYGVALRIAAPRWCTDNAAMIAAAGAFRVDQGERDGWDLVALPHSSVARGHRGRPIRSR